MRTSDGVGAEKGEGCLSAMFYKFLSRQHSMVVLVQALVQTDWNGLHDG